MKWLEDLSAAGYAPFPVLVLSPKPLCQWGEEIEKHTDLTYVLVKGSAKQRVQALKQVAHIYVMNHDALRSDPICKMLGVVHTAFERGGKTKHFFRYNKKPEVRLCAVVVDESTLLKESRTLRFRALRTFCSRLPFRAILAGRPILEQVEDIWSQMLFLDDGQTFGTSFWKFRHRYFYPGPPWDPYNWQLKPGAEAGIGKELSKLCIRVPKDEVENELPPKRYIKIHFELPCREKYEQLRKKFQVELLSGDSFDTQWAVVKSQKLHELCQGFFYTGGGSYELWHKDKLDWIEENVPLLLPNGPLLIWTNFRACVDLIQAVLTVPSRCYHGGMSDTESADAIKAFKGGKVDVLVLSQAKGYQMLDLWRASQAIFFSTDYSAGKRLNAEDRCHRIVSTHENVTYYDLVMRNTIDEVVLDAIKNKLNVFEEILKHIKGD